MRSTFCCLATTEPFLKLLNDNQDQQTKINIENYGLRFVLKLQLKVVVCLLTVAPSVNDSNICRPLIKPLIAFSPTVVLAGNALDELRRVIAVLQSPHAHTTALPPTPVSYDLLHGFPGKLFQGVQDMQGLPASDPQGVTAGGPSADGAVTSGESN